jgi:hypothetical protein
LDIDERIAQPLMIPLAVIVFDVFGDRPAELAFAERNHAVEARLFFNRPHEAFGVCIRVWRLKRRLHHADRPLAQPGTHWGAPFRVAITIGRHDRGDVSKAARPSRCPAAANLMTITVMARRWST